MPVPALLAQTREEEEAARKAGMDKSAPKQYQFIKESLDALEAQHSVKERAAREQAYERNRRRLNVSGRADLNGAANADGAASDEEVDDLRSRLATMSDDEFKALAMARKARAEADLSSKEAAKEAAPPSTRATAVDISDDAGAAPLSARSGKGGSGGKAGSGGKGGGKGGGGADKGSTGGATPRGAAAPNSARGKGGGGGGGGGAAPARNKKPVPLDPKDDPDYRR